MPVTRINCPNCGKPFSAEVNQLFDVGHDPEAKQILLSGMVNVATCPSCGYQGPLSVPMVYHDPDKELLLTYIPPEVNLPRPEQERLIGSLIQQILNKLPQEKRKAYLLQPQSVLTMQGLIERVLEGDGITREMIQSQQQRIRLIQRLLGASEDVLKETVTQENALFDEEFFGILARLVETSTAAGDRASAQALVDLQRNLLPITDFGREIQAQSAEIEAAMKDLREIGQGLTRERLLDLLIEAPNETRLGALVSMTRPGLDYTFFQLLSERIEQSSEENKLTLINLREKLLEVTGAIDEQIEKHREVARQNLEILLKVEDIPSTVLQNMQALDDHFMEVLNQEIDSARKNGDIERSAKLSQVAQAIQQATTPPELELIEELIQLPDQEAIRARMVELQDHITPGFMEMLTGILSQSQSQQDPEVGKRLQEIYRTALKISMEANLNS
jgi:hypothetical protein